MAPKAGGMSYVNAPHGIALVNKCVPSQTPANTHTRCAHMCAPTSRVLQPQERRWGGGLRTVAAAGCWCRPANHVGKVCEAVRAVGKALHKNHLARAVGGQPQGLQQPCRVAAGLSRAGVPHAERLDVRDLDDAVAVRIELEEEVGRHSAVL